MCLSLVYLVRDLFDVLHIFPAPLCKTSIEKVFLALPGSVKRTYKYPGMLWLRPNSMGKKVTNSCDLCSHTKAVLPGCVGDPETTTPTNVTFDCQTNTERREYLVSSPSSYTLNDRMISPTIFHLYTALAHKTTPLGLAKNCNTQGIITRLSKVKMSSSVCFNTPVPNTKRTNGSPPPQKKQRFQTN